MTPASLPPHRPRAARAAARLAYVAGPPLLVAALAVGAWLLLTATVYRGKSYLFPGPVEVLSAFIGGVDAIGAGLLITLREAFLGYASAIVVGVTGAAALSQSRVLERCLYPYAVLLQTVPVVAIAPLIVLWFGYNEISVVVISAILSVFPIVNNTLLGLRSTSRNLVELFQMHRTGWVTAFLKLRLPGAVPSIMAGLRISAGLSVIGAIVGEFIIGSGNSQGGMGVQIIFAQGRMDTALLFAEIIVTTSLGFLFFSLVSLASDLLLRHWHESASEG